MTRFRRPGDARRGRAWWIAGLTGGLGLALAYTAWVLHGSKPDPAVTSPPVPDPVSAVAEGPILLGDVTAGTGITFVHTHGGSGEQYIVEAMTGGVALFDYDGDGLIDIYFLNATPLPRGSQVGPAPTNRLYRNNGDWTFTDVTEEAGVADTGYGLGVTIGDYNNNGLPDIYVNNFGPNVMYRNNGDGTFTDVTAETGVADGDKVGAGASFFDMDGNGYLDLYSANYVEFAYELNPRRIIGGYHRAPSPLDFAPEPDTLFRNNGDGTFTDVSEDSGIGAHRGTGMGMVAGDFNNSGHVDVFICNDVWPNFLFENDGTGRFREVGLSSGVAYDQFGRANGSMGVDAADYNNNGFIDFFMTAYQTEPPVLYRNLGNGFFEDFTLDSGAGEGSTPHVNWGCGFVDFDNDGYRDIFVANGHLEPMIEQIDRLAAYRAPNVVLRNMGNGRFENVTASAGDGLAVRGASRGTGFDDLDNNGRVDVVVQNSDGKPTILRNETENRNHWLQIRLRGVTSNRDAVGARVTVTARDLTLIDEVRSGRGYQSHHGTRLHFGLGPRAGVDRVEVRWPGGAVEAFEVEGADRLVTLAEGGGREFDGDAPR